VGREDGSAAKPQERVAWALRRADIAVQALKEQRLRPLGMAGAHYSLLMSVYAEPGLAGAELARRLGVTPQAIASLVARLEDQGQLERRPHPRHRNVQELYLTDSGYAALQAADDEIAAIEQQITRRLAPADTVQLTALLARVADAARST
jgi:DNA-binding MarR family transcriptional regulator